MEPNDSGDLEPLTPEDGVSMYKQDRRDEVSEATLQSHGYRLQRFVEWCDERDIENLNEITGRDTHRFKLYRKAEVSPPTLKSQMDTLRVFLRFCEDIDAVRDGVAESVTSPTLDANEKQSGDILPSKRAADLLAYLDKYEYATHEHVIARLLWESGARTGSLLAIDLDDVRLRNAYIEIRHRPDTGTPLKNGAHGERDIALSSQLVGVLRDYIEEQRPEVTDEHGRKPLLATGHGRMTTNTFRYYTYQLTRPCVAGEECPHDRDPEECDARDRRYEASKCPSSRSPHALRRGAITHFLSEDVPDTVVSDRMNVSKETLDEHYDARSSRQKMNQRREHLPSFD
ncbi:MULTISPECIES: tyrosine-type recombinase/integrase [Haloarcula]|uniref:tyrosine-type recombinase/integrase n=1 Tax=Haloarcula TaxID=2237 RepID=UPI0023EDBECC|nr:site-specific integrase [Halomicroarcula sp. XH51]